MNKTRRLFAGASVLAIPAALAACSNKQIKNFNNQLTVTLPKTQAQAQVILNALNETYTVASADPTVSKKTLGQAKVYLDDLTKAVGIFVGIKVDTSSTMAEANSIAQIITKIITVLPIPITTKTYIILALTIIQAFAAGQATVPVVPNNTNGALKLYGAGRMEGLGTIAPIAIPLS